MTYGKRLSQAISERKTSRRKLADYIGCTPQIIGMVISGGGKTERKLSTDNHARAVEFLHVPDRWLLTGDGEISDLAHANTAAAIAPTVQASSTLSAECELLCRMFVSLPDDPFVRADIMGKISAMIQQAKDPTSHQDRPGQRTGT